MRPLTLVAAFASVILLNISAFAGSSNNLLQGRHIGADLSGAPGRDLHPRNITDRRQITLTVEELHQESHTYRDIAMNVGQRLDELASGLVKRDDQEYDQGGYEDLLNHIAKIEDSSDKIRRLLLEIPYKTIGGNDFEKVNEAFRFFTASMGYMAVGALEAMNTIETSLQCDHIKGTINRLNGLVKEFLANIESLTCSRLAPGWLVRMLYEVHIQSAAISTRIPQLCNTIPVAPPCEPSSFNEKTCSNQGQVLKGFDEIRQKQLYLESLLKSGSNHLGDRARFSIHHGNAFVDESQDLRQLLTIRDNLTSVTKDLRNLPFPFKCLSSQESQILATDYRAVLATINAVLANIFRLVTTSSPGVNCQDSKDILAEYNHELKTVISLYTVRFCELSNPFLKEMLERFQLMQSAVEQGVDLACNLQSPSVCSQTLQSTPQSAFRTSTGPSSTTRSSTGSYGKPTSPTSPSSSLAAGASSAYDHMISNPTTAPTGKFNDFSQSSQGDTREKRPTISFARDSIKDHGSGSEGTRAAESGNRSGFIHRLSRGEIRFSESARIEESQIIVGSDRVNASDAVLTDGPYRSRNSAPESAYTGSVSTSTPATRSGLVNISASGNGKSGSSSHQASGLVSRSEARTKPATSRISKKDSYQDLNSAAKTGERESSKNRLLTQNQSGKTRVSKPLSNSNNRVPPSNSPNLGWSSTRNYRPYTSLYPLSSFGGFRHLSSRVKIISNTSNNGNYTDGHRASLLSENGEGRVKGSKSASSLGRSSRDGSRTGQRFSGTSGNDHIFSTVSWAGSAKDFDESPHSTAVGSAGTSIHVFNSSTSALVDSNDSKVRNKEANSASNSRGRNHKSAGAPLGSSGVGIESCFSKAESSTFVKIASRRYAPNPLSSTKGPHSVDPANNGWDSKRSNNASNSTSSLESGFGPRATVPTSSAADSGKSRRFHASSVPDNGAHPYNGLMSPSSKGGDKYYDAGSTDNHDYRRVTRPHGDHSSGSASKSGNGEISNGSGPNGKSVEKPKRGTSTIVSVSVTSKGHGVITASESGKRGSIKAMNFESSSASSVKSNADLSGSADSGFNHENHIASSSEKNDGSSLEPESVFDHGSIKTLNRSLSRKSEPGSVRNSNTASSSRNVQGINRGLKFSSVGHCRSKNYLPEPTKSDYSQRLSPRSGSGITIGINGDFHSTQSLKDDSKLSGQLSKANESPLPANDPTTRPGTKAGRGSKNGFRVSKGGAIMSNGELSRASGSINIDRESGPRYGSSLIDGSCYSSASDSSSKQSFETLSITALRTSTFTSISTFTRNVRDSENDTNTGSRHRNDRRIRSSHNVRSLVDSDQPKSRFNSASRSVVGKASSIASWAVTGSENGSKAVIDNATQLITDKIHYSSASVKSLPRSGDGSNPRTSAKPAAKSGANKLTMVTAIKALKSGPNTSGKSVSGFKVQAESYTSVYGTLRRKGADNALNPTSISGSDTLDISGIGSRGPLDGAITSLSSSNMTTSKTTSGGMHCVIPISDSWRPKNGKSTSDSGHKHLKAMESFGRGSRGGTEQPKSTSLVHHTAETKAAQTRDKGSGSESRALETYKTKVPAGTKSRGSLKAIPETAFETYRSPDGITNTYTYAHNTRQYSYIWSGDRHPPRSRHWNTTVARSEIKAIGASFAAVPPVSQVAGGTANQATSGINSRLDSPPYQEGDLTSSVTKSSSTVSSTDPRSMTIAAEATEAVNGNSGADSYTTSRSLGPILFSEGLIQASESRQKEITTQLIDRSQTTAAVIGAQTRSIGMEAPMDSHALTNAILNPSIIARVPSQSQSQTLERSNRNLSSASFEGSKIRYSVSAMPTDIWGTKTTSMGVSGHVGSDSSSIRESSTPGPDRNSSSPLAPPIGIVISLVFLGIWGL